jgi:hypothetical protein
MADTRIVCRVHEGNTLGGVMNNLFCTPEQGARLKELLPELEYAFMWASLSDDKWFIIEQRSITDGAFVEFRPTFVPALTLQELRDVAKEHIKPKHPLRYDGDMIYVNLYLMTAPELAEWVIQRLEEGR